MCTAAQHLPAPTGPNDKLGTPARAGLMLNGQGFTLLAGSLRMEAGDSTRAALLHVVTEICRSRQPHKLSAGANQDLLTAPNFASIVGSTITLT